MALPFLDSYSTIQLAKYTQSWQKVQLCMIVNLGQAHRLTQDIVLGHRVWNKLMERECLFKQRGRDFVQNRIQVLDIVHLLKSMEDPLPHLRDLLGQICKRFPPTDPSLVGVCESEPLPPQWIPQSWGQRIPIAGGS